MFTLKRSCISFLFILIFHYTSYGQYWQWAIEGAGTESMTLPFWESVESYKSVTDEDGNTYLTGYFVGKVRLGSFVLDGNHKINLFIAKYDATGKVLWVKRSDAQDYCIGADLGLDQQGNLLVMGQYKDAVTIDAHRLPAPVNASSTNIFLLKMNTISGEVAWITSTSGTGIAEAHSLAVDPDGNTFIAGTFNETISIGAATASNTGEPDTFLAKYDDKGKILHSKFFQIDGMDEPEISIDGAGNCYMSGNYRNKAILGSYTFTTGAWDYETYLAKFDNNLNVIWAKKSETTGLSKNKDIATDAAGFSYVTGYFLGTKSFGNVTLTEKGTTILYLAKFDPTGDIVWAVKATSPRTVVGHSIAIDAAGNSYVSGLFSISATFGNLTITTPNRELFVTKFSPDGQAIWATQSNSESIYELKSTVGVDGKGNSYLSGNFVNTATFGLLTLRARRPEFVSSFLAKIGAPEGKPVTLQGLKLEATTFCGGENLNVHFDAQGTFNDGNSFKVQLSDAKGSFAAPQTIGSGTTSPITATIPRYIGTGTGYKIRLIAESPYVDGGTYEEPITIYKTPLKPALSAYFLCGWGIDGGVITIETGAPPPGQAFKWYASKTSTVPMPGQQETQFVTPFLSEDTTFYVTLVGENGCESERVAVPIDIILSPVVEIGPNEMVCISKGPFMLSGFTPSDGTWSGKGVTANGIFDPAAVGLGTHTLTFTYTKRNCSVIGTKTVEVLKAPVLVAAATDNNSCPNSNGVKNYVPFTTSFINESQQATSYLWEFGDGSTSTQKAPSHTYNKPGQYDVYLTITSESGCTERQLITTVEAEESSSIPNVFTPNGDNLNETFITNVSCFPTHLKVFNRWGKLVFDKANYQNDWSGGGQPAGIYFYQLQASNGQSWKGWVEIIR